MSLALRIVAFCMLLCAAPAQAQSAQETALAREQFERGVAAARAGEWENARQAFERSHGLAARPTTLLNWASALVRTGRLVEGAERYREFIRTARDARSRRQRAAAQDALREVLPRIARLRLEVRGYVAGDVIAIDREPVSPAALGEELPIDPGTHAVTVTRGGRTVGGEVHAGDGERVSLTVDASGLVEQRPAPSAEPAPVMPAARPRPAEDGFFDSPWPWILAGVLVVGGAVAVGFAVSADGRDPVQGTVPPYRVGVE